MDQSTESLYGITFENVWMEKNQELLDEIVEAWNNVGAIPPGQSGIERAKQVVYIVRNEKKKIIGISTAYLSGVKRLRNNFFIYRCMVFPGNKIPGLFTKLTDLSLKYLESIHTTLKRKVIGVLTEVENKELQKLNLAILTTGLIFIGYSKRGNPIRVYYFKGAKI